MRNNVKFSVFGLVLDDATGVQYIAPIVSNIEGNLMDFTDRLLSLISGAQPIGTMPITFKLMVKKSPLYADGSYQDKATEYLKEGVLIKVTHVRHSQLKIWVETPSPMQFEISHIRDTDLYGRYLEIGLKETPR